MTYCHFGVKRSENKIKVGIMTNFGMGNSIMTLVVKIDAKLRVISRN